MINDIFMKKKLLKKYFVTAIAMVSGINVFNAQKTEALSDVALYITIIGDNLV